MAKRHVAGNSTGGLCDCQQTKGRPAEDGYFPTASPNARLALHKHNGIRTPACSAILLPNGVRIKLQVDIDS